MKRLGIISGTLISDGKRIISDLNEYDVDTAFGRATVFRNTDVVFIARHGKNPNQHILPHLINHAANISAMKQFGVGEIIGIYSTGSTKHNIEPGMLVVPHDYILLGTGPTVIRQNATHIVPFISGDIRRKIIETVRDCGLDCIDGGIYWQNAGPRLETRAEIAVMSQFADLVGMTMASEAIIAQELDITFASLCSVDNYAHGLVDEALTMEEIVRHARQNSASIISILIRYIERWKTQQNKKEK